MNRRSTRPIRSPGFTLIEMLVVILIVVLLMGLIVAVSVGVMEKSERSRTENILTLLDTAMTEWQNATGRTLTFGITGQPIAGATYEIDETATPDVATLAAMSIVMRPEGAKNILAQISPDSAKSITGPPPSIRVNDAWDNQVLAIFPGRTWVDGFDPLAAKDIDGSIRTAHEDIYGVCPSRKIVFVSAGPDGRFGSLDPSATQQEKDEAADNIYSFEVIQP